MKFYHDWALRILEGHWTEGHAFYGLPGYPVCLGGIYSIVGVSPFTVGILQCTLEALTAVFIGLLGSQFAKNSHANTPGTGIGLLAGLGWIAFQPAQVYSILLMPTSWVITAFWGLVVWVTRVDPQTTWRSWLVMGLLIGGVSLLVATVLMLLPLVLAAIWLHTRTDAPSRRRLVSTSAAAAILFSGVVAGMAPAWMHNYFVAHEPVLLSAHSGLNFWLGNNPEATGYPDRIPGALRTTQQGLLQDSVTVARRETGRDLTHGEVSAYWSAKAKAWISGHRADWLALLGRKFGRFWNAFQYDDLAMISPLRNCGVLSDGLRFGVVAALAIPGLVLGILRRPGTRWIAAAIALHLAALLPVFVTERYRLCAVPGLLLFASFGLWQLWSWLSHGRWVQTLAYVAAAGCSALFVGWPQSDNSLLALDHYNAGLRAHRIGDLSTAQRELEFAAACIPENFDVNFALGNLWQSRNDLTKAKAFYSRTLNANHGHADAWNCLGAIAILEGNWPEASRCLERKVALNPQDARTYYLLARVRMELNDRVGARLWIREALARQPGQPDFEATLKELEKPE